MKSTRPLVGIVLVDKPSGLTSNQVLQRAKRLFRARKAGHTGTLDPMATGMLPVCFGAATKVSGMMLDSRKRYRVTATFGTATDTGDATGTVTETCDKSPPAPEAVRSAVTARRGQSLQVPPMYSAVKHQGRRLYELARQGAEVRREPREIEIFELTIEAFDWPDLALGIHCSKGTYVRTVITDIAAALGTVA
ncbi:MAG TPA: tRNA pseudouridine(55) synthase TruB, partial [Gammaproteobacteria bacterium]|nr:tRNA pseudouridine(55) synthase TruB [Gammaproteobacteria bacterium]